MTDIAQIAPTCAATSGIGGFFARILAEFRAEAQIRATVRELQALSNRELTDLGITRFSIRDIAREAVRG